MTRDQVLSILRERESGLRVAGVAHLSLFGPVAREEPSARDVDVAVRLDGSFSRGGLDYFGQLEDLERRLGALLGRRVDVVEEPARKARFQEEINRDRAVAF